MDDACISRSSPPLRQPYLTWAKHIAADGAPPHVRPVDIERFPISASIIRGSTTDDAGPRVTRSQYVDPLPVRPPAPRCLPARLPGREERDPRPRRRGARLSPHVRHPALRAAPPACRERAVACRASPGVLRRGEGHTRRALGPDGPPQRAQASGLAPRVARRPRAGGRTRPAASGRRRARPHVLIDDGPHRAGDAAPSDAQYPLDVPGGEAALDEYASGALVRWDRGPDVCRRFMRLRHGIEVVRPLTERLSLLEAPAYQAAGLVIRPCSSESTFGKRLPLSGPCRSGRYQDAAAWSSKLRRWLGSNTPTCLPSLVRAILMGSWRSESLEITAASS